MANKTAHEQGYYNERDSKTYVFVHKKMISRRFQNSPRTLNVWTYNYLFDLMFLPSIL